MVLTKKKIITILISLYVFFVPLDGITINWFENYGTLSKMVSYMILLSFIILILSNKKFNLSKDIILFIGIIFYGFITLLWSDFISIYEIILLIYLFMLLIIIHNFLVWDYLDVRTIQKSYVIGNLILVALSFSKINSNLYTGNRISISQNFNPNIYAGFLSLACIVSLYIYFTEVKKRYAFLFILFFGFLILSQSRTAIISLIFSFGVSLFILIIKDNFIYRKKIHHKLFKLVTFFVIIFIFITLLMIFLYLYGIDFSYFERFESLFSKNLDKMTAGRTTIWVNSLKMMNRKDYIIGKGFTSFRKEYKSSYVKDYPAHNIYIDVFFELGLIGLVLIVSYFIKLYSFVFNKKTNYYNKWFLLVLINYVFIFGFGNDGFEYKFYWLFLIFIHLINYGYYLEGNKKVEKRK